MTKTISMWKSKDCFFCCYVYIYVDCICVTFHSSLKSLTPLKYFAVVELQTIFRRQYVGVSVSIYLSPYLQFD